MRQERVSQHQFGRKSPARLKMYIFTTREPFLEGLSVPTTLLFVLLVIVTPFGTAWAEGKKTIGWIEQVAITTEGLTMEAKVDTGADFSSVHAEAIRYFRRDDARWVEFTLRDQHNNTYTLERPLQRMAKIKKKTLGFQTRPVVTLRICIGDEQHPAQVNLAQRQHFKYPLLLGRHFLKSRFLVDPGEKNLTKPSCQ